MCFVFVFKYFISDVLSVLFVCSVDSFTDILLEYAYALSYLYVTHFFLLNIIVDAFVNA